MTAPVLTLASASPRRKQLLEMLGVPVEVRPANVPEIRGDGELPAAYVERLARTKAVAVPGTYVLGADTTVVLGDQVLEKPADAADAVRMLQALRGRSHEVLTAIALAHAGTVRSLVDRSRVTFRSLDDEALRAYVATGEPMDKAGAYGIQGYGAALVEHLDGDFFSVMGLPVRRVLDLLETAGWRYRFGQ
jgi:septum formation protein